MRNLRDYGYDNMSTGTQILNGVFTSFWLISLPFFWTYKFCRWFFREVTKEVGIRMVNYTAWIIFAMIIGLIYRYLN